MRAWVPRWAAAAAALGTCRCDPPQEAAEISREDGAAPMLAAADGFYVYVGSWEMLCQPPEQ